MVIFSRWKNILRTNLVIYCIGGWPHVCVICVYISCVARTGTDNDKRESENDEDEDDWVYYQWVHINPCPVL